jgi:hypothetical protein
MKKHILKIIKEYDRSERAAMMDRKRIFRDLSGNYPEFYSNFENIFLNSYDLFKKAIIELKDISDPIYVEMLSDFEKTSAVVEVFVIRYILRLSFCFNIDVENNPLIIRKIIESVNGTEKREMVWGEAIELMASVCGESKGESPQLYYGDYGATADNRILDNVINLVGMTTHRQFINLMWRCSGVLTPVSYPMHLATMQWKDHPEGKRPCVVIAGSR